MPNIAYLDCPTGIAGDMLLGALLHAGVPLAYLTEKLALLGIAHEYHLWSEFVDRNGQQATKFHVDLQQDPQLESLNSNTFAPSQPERSQHSSHSSHHSLHHSTQTSDHHSHSHSHAHEHSHPHGTRHLSEIEHLILAAGLPPRAEIWSLAIFRQLATAEGAVHGIPPEQVHFHEVGATDAIVDIVGTCLGLDWLNIDVLYCSPLPTGGGTIRAAHGILPVPTPAVLKLYEMHQVPIYSNGIQRELVTPTGAAIATTLASAFGNSPPMRLHRIGLGAGSRNLPLPNILRLWIGSNDEVREPERHKGHEEEKDSPQRRGERREGERERGRGGERERAGSQNLALGTLQSRSKLPHTVKQKNATVHCKAESYTTQHWTPQIITLLETQIDDLNPQAIGYVFDRLLAVGALDVFTQAIGMKKCRPGILLSVVCRPEQAQACEAILFRETTTLGIRRSIQQRNILQRDMQTVQIPYGAVRVKVATDVRTGNIMNVQPEYEDCAQLARQSQLPWREIHRLALQAWYQTANEG